MTFAFGLGFIVFGIVAFSQTAESQRQFESKLQSIQAGTTKPDTLTVVRKYVDPGRSGLPHIVFSSNRQPIVNLAVTVVLFNSLNPGDTIPGYYFPDGYFIPQNRRGNPGTGKWFFLSLGVLPGAGVLVLAVVRARKRSPDVDMDELQKILRDRMDGH